VNYGVFKKEKKQAELTSE